MNEMSEIQNCLSIAPLRKKNNGNPADPFFSEATISLSKLGQALLPDISGSQVAILVDTN
jgi:hypothetical protein